ncbi:MAG: Enolase [Berkelbacteria bacterium GW2011_GWA2_35_9]|uniref:Enolase n=1 Tax=Berkelbacteria bacterium GW2011_GWA2_35_9 TaxID=1618333 RepID=A0A0G0D7F8_9BACT|nr:MAG: Enolase [Berkelbacteria bacterium GW2011_GWA2_35_9]
MSSRIKNLFPRVIINSRCEKTIEIDLISDNWEKVTASVPSGKSKGKKEIVEVKADKAVNLIENKIFSKIKGFELCQQIKFDQLLNEYGDNVGSNTKLVLSIAYLKLSSLSLSLENYAYIRHYLTKIHKSFYHFPTPYFNMVNGGVHANNNLGFQEFLVIPKLKASFKENYWSAVEIYQSLKLVLIKSGLGTTIADEGGYSFDLKDDTKVFDLLKIACTEKSLVPGKEIFFGIDASADNLHKSADNLTSTYEKIMANYPLVYLEDPYSENDFKYWLAIMSKKNHNFLIVGDDLTVTNSQYINQYAQQKLINGVIIKPNQIGTITQTLEAIETAKKNHLKIIVSHRSGETNDDFIADFALAVEADGVKFGAPARGERVAKYNRLLKIEDNLINQTNNN